MRRGRLIPIISFSILSLATLMILRGASVQQSLGLDSLTSLQHI